MWKRSKGGASDYKSPDIYKYYKNLVENPVDIVTFNNVCTEFNTLIQNKIYEGTIYHLPANLGYIGITTKKVTPVFTEDNEIDYMKSKLTVDWGTTNKIWIKYPELQHKKYIYCINTHTDGNRYTITWKRLFVRIRGAKNYKFTPVRQFKRNLATYINNNPNLEYYEF